MAASFRGRRPAWAWRRAPRCFKKPRCRRYGREWTRPPGTLPRGCALVACVCGPDDPMAVLTGDGLPLSLITLTPCLPAGLRVVLRSLAWAVRGRGDRVVPWCLRGGRLSRTLRGGCRLAQSAFRS